LERLVLDESQATKDNMSVGRGREVGLMIDRGLRCTNQQRDSFLQKRSGSTSKLTRWSSNQTMSAWFMELVTGARYLTGGTPCDDVQQTRRNIPFL
jgi:hypothetical protein